MIDILVKEINMALEHKLYLAALTLTLTLPDICGKAKNPKAHSKERYIDWYNEYIGRFERCPIPNRPSQPSQYEQYEKLKSELEDMPCLNGEVVYSLRCSILHQGNPNIDNEKCKIDRFTLILEGNQLFHLYFGEGGEISKVSSCKQIKSYSVHVRRFCMALSSTALSYYNENKNCFNFFDYRIVDKDTKTVYTESSVNNLDDIWS